MTRVRLPKKAMMFDGIDDYVDCGGDLSLNMDYEYTIIVRANIRNATHLGAGKVERFDWRESAIIDRYYRRPYSLRIVDSSGHIGMVYERTDGSAQSVISALTVKDGENFIGYSFSLHTQEVMFFANGKFETVGITYDDSYALQNFGALQLGRFPDGSWQFNGDISQVLMYNRKLSEDEIRWAYKHLDDPITNSLVLWLDEDSVGSNTWQDLSGKGNDGTVYGATPVDVRPWTASRIQNTSSVNNYSRLKVAEPTRWLRFDGVDDYINFSYQPDTNEFTIVALVKPISKVERYWASTTSSAGGWHGWRFGHKGTELRFHAPWDINLIFEIANVLNLNEYNKVVVRKSGDTYTMFVNGSNVGSMTVAGNITKDVLRLGYDIASGYFFDGEIAKFLIYNKALTDDEIRYLYEHQDPPITYGLVLWLDESSIGINTWYDKSGNGNDGTIYGAVYESR